ncbi:MAG: bifunctional heptose 7-phosphate kinase/heptose 1-phosphate adenyltransferase [Limisphaerales bacterium]
MHPARFDAITARYPGLRVAIVGDFCLDRYLEIDPARKETSIETGLPVHNVVRVRSQPGAAGTILNNLVALGVRTIYPVGFCGRDGEGFELQQALRATAGVSMDHFVETPHRRTFTYCKPLLIESGKAPVELNRLDSKNWTPTPTAVEDRLGEAVARLAGEVDAMIVMDQVDLAGTGVVTARVLEALAQALRQESRPLIIADSRRGLGGFPPVIFKMNGAELAALIETPAPADVDGVRRQAIELARRHQQRVFVTLAERGIVGATPEGASEHVPSLALRGEIDIVGAGDAVTANLATALAAGGDLREALVLSSTAASVVIHQLGTTGTASVPQIRALAVAG